MERNIVSDNERRIHKRRSIAYSASNNSAGVA